MLLVVAAGGCSSAPRVIPLSASSEPPKPAAEIRDYRDAFHAIAVVMGRDLGLPVPPVSLYLYPNREAYEQALRTEFSVEPGLARATAGFSRGMGGAGKILINEDMLARTPWPERIRFLSHEFTHTIQYDLAGGRRRTSAQWLREGFAEWVSYRTVEALDLGHYADWLAMRRRQFLSIRDAKTPPLSQLSTSVQWINSRSQQGGEVTYNQAFLAVDFLVERHGHPAAVEYFRLFARSDDRLANFRAAFGQELSIFEREFATYLDGLR